MRLLIGCCISATLGLLSFSPAAFSEETVTATPAAAGNQTAAQSAPASGAPAAPTAAATGAPVAGQPAQDANTAVAGPLQEQRQALLDKIEASKKLGFGIGPYKAAFNQVEDMAKAGASPELIQKRLDSIRSGLMEQAARVKDIKQRPSLPPPVVSRNTPATGGGPLSGRQQMLEQMKEKYGDQIRGALDNPEIRAKLADPAERQRLLESPLGQKLLEKYRGGGGE